MMPGADPQRAPGSRRIEVLDLARGVALGAMIVFHLGWDLAYFGLIDRDLGRDLAWVWFGRVIAASFLVLVGVNLVLAEPRAGRLSGFLRRLARIAAAALAVTLGTYVAFPEQFVFFGILHAIAVCSIIALPFLGVPARVIAGVAAVAMILPAVVHREEMSSPWLVWLGLGTRVPATTDFVPVFPWLGCVLLGMALAKTVDFRRFAGKASAAPPARLLARAGRHSLIVYLVHQPILFGVLWLGATAFASVSDKPDRETRGFLAACQSQCRGVGADPALCASICQCSADAMKAERLWAGALRESLDPGQKLRVDALTKRCAETATSSPRPDASENKAASP